MLPERIRDYNPMKRFDSMFNDFFENFNLNFPTDFFESEFFHSDIFRGDGNEIYVDVPGFNSDNLNVEFNKGLVEVNGENDTGRKISKKIRLGTNLSEPINAEVKDGVLKLEFEDKTEPEKKKIKLNNPVQE